MFWTLLMTYLGMVASRTGNENASKIANLGSLIGSLGSNGQPSALKQSSYDDYMGGLSKVGRNLIQNQGFLGLSLRDKL